MQLLHGRVPIELHTLRSAKGPSLLLLHELGSNGEKWPADVLSWSGGSVYALDFTGHGRSGHPRGGAYHPEYFLADADLALERIGEPCAVVGAGLGAYVALLLAGSRPDFIGAALLLAGEGLRGVGSRPDDEIAFEGIEGFDRFIARTSMNYVAGTDPLVAQCACDMRPVDYASSFAESARPMLFDERVGADPEGPPPAWWQVALEKNRGSHAPEAFSAALEALGSLTAEA